MLLTNRRHRILYLLLAGMEVAWFTPLILLFLNNRRNRLPPEMLGGPLAPHDGLGMLLGMAPLGLFFFFFVIMTTYMLIADILNQRQVESPQRELLLLALFTASSLLLTRLLFHAQTNLLDMGWIGQVVGGVFNFTEQPRPETPLLIVSAFIWFRVAFNTSRSLAFFQVALSFRLGLLLMILVGIWLNMSQVGSSGSAISYFLLFMFCGLGAVAIARIDEKSIDASHSSGALMPWPRLLQIVAAVTTILAVTWLLSAVYTIGTLRAFLRLFSPIWAVIGRLLTLLLTAIFWVITPLINRLLEFMNGLEFFRPRQAEPPEFEPFLAPDLNINDVLAESPSLRFALVFSLILIALLLIWIYFVRTRRRIRSDESEREDVATRVPGANPLSDAWKRLRDLLAMVGRYGLSQQLLDAVSVQNIYANTSRLARRRGYPRHPAQPPDQYLVQLRQAFPGLESELASITDAYMRVEYGAASLDTAGMADLRAGYHRIRDAPLPTEEQSTEEQSTEANPEN